MKMFVRATPSRAGITLVEMLAVIAIIAILMSLLLPKVMDIRELAVSTKCRSHLRAMHSHAMTYAADHEGLLPAPWGRRIDDSGNDVRTWQDQLPYTLSEHITGIGAEWGNPNRMNHRTVPEAFCPTMLQMGVWWTWDASKARAWTTYSFSMLARDRSQGNHGELEVPSRVDHITSPSTATMFADGAVPPGEYQGFPKINAWNDYHYIRIDPHDGDSNYVHVDGHLSTMSSDEVTEAHFLGESLSDDQESERRRISLRRR